ncbi:MAG: histone-like nucleoid-structuring protein Lsr2 [Brevibacterium aurantiacum]|uniref:histone-like nucleoid-structuring protein Lsr2 n=1 Tax=Brevibacterium aurantiacum TaxID=273384 RepID=UPI003F8E1181
MAQKIIQILVDDIDGTAIPNGEGETLSFGLDGRSYEIDLTSQHATELRHALDRYVSASRKVPGAKRQQVRRTVLRDLNAVRAWARSHGYEVSDKGRVPFAVLDAYDQAN